MRRPSVLWPLAGVAAGAMAVFVALTIVVTTNPSLAADSRAFHIANELRTPALDHAARIVTTLGLLVIVGPVLLIGAALLIHRRRRACAAPLLIGAALAWISVWITKAAVDRARPPAPLVHTSGQSYPSGHAANSVGYLALAIALTVAIPPTPSTAEARTQEPAARRRSRQRSPTPGPAENPWSHPPLANAPLAPARSHGPRDAARTFTSCSPSPGTGSATSESSSPSSPMNEFRTMAPTLESLPHHRRRPAGNKKRLAWRASTEEREGSRRRTAARLG